MTDPVLKLDTSKDFIELHPLNIPPILVTLEVSKLDKSITTILLHPENIEFIFFTEEVLNFFSCNKRYLKFPLFFSSRLSGIIVCNKLHPEKSELISVTNDVSKLDKSTKFN